MSHIRTLSGWLALGMVVMAASSYADESQLAYRPYETFEEQRGYDPDRFRSYEQPTINNFNNNAPYYDRDNDDRRNPSQCRQLMNEFNRIAEQLSDSARQLHRCAEARDPNNSCSGEFRQTAHAQNRYENVLIQMRNQCR